jgi:hypothetical protein
LTIRESREEQGNTEHSEHRNRRKGKKRMYESGEMDRPREAGSRRIRMGRREETDEDKNQ